MPNTVKPYGKYSADEWMEAVNVFNIRSKGISFKR